MQPPESLQAGLRERGCHVVLVGSHADALRELEGTEYDLVVSELRLADDDGLELLRTVQRLAARTPFVFCTAFPSIQGAKAAIATGAHDFMTKPVTAAEVMARLRCPSPALEAVRWLDLQSARDGYIDIMLQHCGSIAQTARVLGLDRRSLRRMLTRTRADVMERRLSSMEDTAP